MTPTVIQNSLHPIIENIIKTIQITEAWLISLDFIHLKRIPLSLTTFVRCKTCIPFPCEGVIFNFHGFLKKAKMDESCFSIQLFIKYASVHSVNSARATPPVLFSFNFTTVVTVNGDIDAFATSRVRSWDIIEWDRTLYCYKPRKMCPNLVGLAF